MNMKLTDIDGTKIGSKNRITKYNSQNTNLNVGDIKGCQPASKKRGITTARQTNPIWPQYCYPGNTELQGQYKNPYGKTAFDDKDKFSRNNFINHQDKNKTTTGFYKK